MNILPIQKYNIINQHLNPILIQTPFKLSIKGKVNCVGSHIEVSLKLLKSF